MKVVHRSRVVRKNQLLSAFVDRQEEYKEAKTAYESAYAKLKAEATRVLKLYAPLKNAVSDRNWDGKRIVSAKLTKSARVIELVLNTNGSYGYTHESFWEFPSWMIGADTDRIVDGLKQIIQDDGIRMAKKEQENAAAQLAATTAAELAQLEELKQKYSEVSDVVSQD
jgi:hypothetical protein